jgi:hypothetical protein
MSGPRILVLSHPGEAEIAVEADGELLDFALWRPCAPDGVGDTHRARIITRAPAMGGAFVALAGSIEGFLPDSEGGKGLNTGDTVQVRVVRAAQGGKGPRLTGNLPPPDPGPLARLSPGPNPVERLAAAYPAAGIAVNDSALAAKLRPLLGERVSIDRAPPAPDLLDQIATLADTAVETLEGPSFSFHPTPALVAIDVDLGPATAERGGKAAAQLAANRALLPALARQIQLRNLSGAILVDLGGMAIKARAELAPDFTRALAADPLKPRLLGFTALGLAEIVRRRIHPPLHELRQGLLAATLAAMRATVREGAPQLRAAPAIIARIESEPILRDDLTRLAPRPVALASDPSLSPLGWSLDR